MDDFDFGSAMIAGLAESLTRIAIGFVALLVLLALGVIALVAAGRRRKEEAERGPRT